MPPTALRRSATAALAAVLTLSALSASPAAATHPGAAGRLALECDDGLWTAEADGSSFTRVTDQEVLDPAWSPGGTRFAFSREMAPDLVSLFTMEADGTDVRRLTRTAGRDFDPDWSPDGLRLVFASYDPGDPWYEIHTRHLSRDYSGSESLAYSTDPSWSPDRRTFAYVLDDPYGNQGIWFNDDSWYDPWTVVTPPAGAMDESPDWAPDGTRYLFVRREGGVASVWTVNVDGTDASRLTDATVDVVAPHYAPDGATIAYLARPAAAAGTAAPYGLWIMNVDGSGKDEVASDLACRNLSWQPIPEFALVDAKYSNYESAIRWAYAAGITNGCHAELFCPNTAITREQMAAFFARAFDLPPATQDYFGDDEASAHEDDINRMAGAGITTGCAPDLFCPTAQVQRQEMASFLVRALDLPPATADYFSDDEDSTHEDAINSLAESGVASGCAEDRFCPRRATYRGPMVAFLYRALGD